MLIKSFPRTLLVGLLCEILLPPKNIKNLWWGTSANYYLKGCLKFIHKRLPTRVKWFRLPRSFDDKSHLDKQPRETFTSTFHSFTRSSLDVTNHNDFEIYSSWDCVERRFPPPPPLCLVDRSPSALDAKQLQTSTKKSAEGRRLQTSRMAF